MGYVAFAAVRRQPKLADQVATALEELIAGRRLLAGEKLPAERALCEQFGVSRTAVREAVRSLEAKGLLEVRSGGGTWVRHPSAAPAAHLLGLAMQIAGANDTGAAGVTWAHLLEARRVLEVEIAGLAAERRTEADVVALEQAMREMKTHEGDAEGWSLADVRFHDALARATKNPLMPMLLGVMQDALLNTRREAYRVRTTPATARERHQRILTQVTLRDGVGARAAMLDHLIEAEATLTLAHETRSEQDGTGPGAG